MTQKTELKPCPFCGAKAIVRSSHDVDGCYWAHVECTVCRARTSGDWASSSSETCPLFYEGVREAWQARAALEAKQVEVQMPEPVAFKVSDPEEPDMGFWLSEDKGTNWQLTEPLYTEHQVRTLLEQHGIKIAD